MELSKALRDHSKTIKGKQQLIMSAYAKALEIIPRQLVRSLLGWKMKPQAAIGRKPKRLIAVFFFVSFFSRLPMGHSMR